ncbi:aspartyl/asparaginyl beta-hydroxylase domain-containing protein [Streptomyces gelaticus]|uniref:aspartyl/asparaginyl beta-hydroxylase domain-containing protein n=1 Tax=Streptomyces gelaticus TaxID=285446 RepID=UPI00379849C1
MLDQVARLVDLEESAIEQMRAEALGAPTRGVVAYGEYQSGGWWTTSLMNHSDSGDPHDVVIRDGRPRPTSLLKEMPATARFLDSLGLNFMYVRLARLEPHSYLWEHRDYAELRETDRHRLHTAPATGHPRKHRRAVRPPAAPRAHPRASRPCGDSSPRSL